jgi:hypothetical protein
LNSAWHGQNHHFDSIDTESDHNSLPLWRLLLLTHDHEESFQPTINECIELLELDIDLLRKGVQPDEIMPMVKYHQHLCSPYRDKLEFWLEKLADDND